MSTATAGSTSVPSEVAEAAAKTRAAILEAVEAFGRSCEPGGHWIGEHDTEVGAAAAGLCEAIDAAAAAAKR